ncbi:MAG: hypothetical protein M3P96_04380 [Actinomycetota bacterium]|nr:hypothetical protein [Actinomycetota bacterium]
MAPSRGLGQAHRRVVDSFVRELLARDPDGRRLSGFDDLDQLGRQAADAVVDDSGRWQEHLGGFYDVEGVRSLLARDGRPVTKQAISKRRGLLALTTGSGRVVYPRFQFRNRSPIPGLAAVLEELPEHLVSRWTVASWLVSPNPELSGEKPVDVLADGYGPAVTASARAWAAQLAT